MVAGEIGGNAGSVRLHGLLARLPSGRSDLSVLVSVLEGLDKPEGLVDVASNAKIVDCDPSEDRFSVDDEEPSERDAIVHLQDPVGLRHGVVLVGQEGDVHLPQTAPLKRSVDPGVVALDGVAGDGDDASTDLPELLDAVAEGDDLGAADEGKVSRVEQHDEVLALVIGQSDPLISAVGHVGLGLDLGSRHSGLKHLGGAEKFRTHDPMKGLEVNRMFFKFTFRKKSVNSGSFWHNFHGSTRWGGVRKI